MKISTKCLVCAILNLAVVTRSAECGKFWHISDIHYDIYYSLNKTTTNITCPSSYNYPSIDPGPWGDYNCDSNFRLINSSIYSMKSIEPTPDFILWTGDDVFHTDEEEKYLNVSLMYDIMSNVTSLIQEAFPDIQVFAALGNHDYLPKNEMPSTPNDIVANTALIWREWLTDDQYALFKETGYCSSITNHAPNLRVIVLNTNTWDLYNPTVTGTGDPAGQFKWFEEQLFLSKIAGNRVFIMGHIAPGFFERVVNETYFWPEYNKRYVKLVEQYKDVISGQFFAHHHTDSFKIFYDADKYPISVLYHVPSVTPRIGTRDGSVNPGVRLFHYEKATTEILDYTQYVFDLQAANDGQNAEWQVEYNFVETYGLPNVSAQSLHDLALKFKASETSGCKSSNDQCNADILQRYSLYNTVSYQKGYCDSICQRNFVCAMQAVDHQLYQDCVNSWNNAVGLRGFQFFSIYFAFGIVLLKF
ncbi:acid sphingomyelinase-like phosphodiesterase 3b isoform X1 [Clavelina lepadiformis]|uniref:acid sphingomyelinase-like phosphodiesterase 3b isoform X1 n=1 Tax=Clavelina lepadiformis TaxID=159417 RepID=UPI0040436ADB